MRAQALSAVKAGITRLREKGGATSDSLFDLVNGYVTAARSIKIRPGSEIDHQLPPGTKGLVLFRGKFVVFATEAVAPGNDDYLVEILKHPDPEATLDDIRFAAPFLGFLYVVARWSIEGADPSIIHYWLQASETWQAEHVYAVGQVVQPTAANGYAYRANRLTDPAAPWAPNIARAIGDRVEPTTPNGYEHVVIDAIGTNPRSGESEPQWATSEGGITIEEADNPAPPTPPTPPQVPPLPPDIPPRYPNPNDPGMPIQLQ